MNAPRRIFPILPLAGLLAAACSSPSSTAPSTDGAAQAGAWDAPPLERCVSLREASTGRELSLADMLDDLARAQVVFLGETHLDESTHRLELAVFEGLLARRPGQVVLSLEMFERDVQPLLDRYLAGEIDEAEFLAGSRPWGNYRTGYRALIESARRAGAPVVAANFPAPLRRSLAQSAAVDLSGLTAEQRAFAPSELLPNGELYWKRVDNAIRGHAAMMGTPDTDPQARLMSTQSLWDNAMGEACATALERWPQSVVLHVNGGFHTAYGDGTARQLLLRRPGTRVRTVSIEPRVTPQSASLAPVPAGDWIAFVESRAADASDGKQEVALTRTLQYRLHVPPGAREDQPLPLLVWLAEDGLESRDGLDLWVPRLGDACLIAAVDAPYRERQMDGTSGRRWAWRDTFAEDVGPVVGGLAEAIGYIARQRAVDPERIVIAGERQGATMAIAAAVALDGAPLSGVAWDPDGLRALADLPLPLLELRGDLPPRRTGLALRVAPGSAQAWSGEVEAYRSVGVDVGLSEFGDDVHRRELELENELRSALGLSSREAQADARRLHAVARGARARQWTRVGAARRAPGDLVAILDAAPSDGVDAGEPLVLDVSPADVRAGAALPRAPGAFGGTTVVVLPRAVEQERRTDWIALEADDPIAKASRFSRLRVATLDDDPERGLETVLARLESEGRRNVLLVPAAFCADGDVLAELRERTQPFAPRLDLAFRAGLGGL